MQDPLQDIKHFSPTMTISQVLTFFQRKEIGITRGMIQNYIRDGLLPPPVSKRLYTHKHLAALVIIDRLKSVFDIPTIQKTLTPYMDDEGLPLDFYSYILVKTANVAASWQTNIAPTLSEEGEAGTLLTMVFATELKMSIAAQEG